MPRWVPTTEKSPNQVDLRCLKLGPKGYKERNKRKFTEVEEEEAAPMLVEPVVAVQDEVQQPSAKRQKADDSTWRPVSGKPWKAVSKQASTVMKSGTRGKKTWTQKMTEKDVARQRLDVKKEALATAKAKRKAVHDQKRAALERKKLNQQKSAVVQKVSNTATVKKMLKSKKQRKLLKKADTN